MSTGMLPYQIVDEVMGKELGDLAVYLSGPSFAAEVIKRQPVSWLRSCNERYLFRSSAMFNPLTQSVMIDCGRCGF